MKRSVCLLTILAALLCSAKYVDAQVIEFQYVALDTAHRIETGPFDWLNRPGAVCNNGYADTRTAFEYSLTQVPGGVRIVSATLTIPLWRLIEKPQVTRYLAVHGYAGNGSIELADFSRDGLQGSADIVSSGQFGTVYQVVTVDVTDLLIGILTRGGSYVGFNVREDPTLGYPDGENTFIDLYKAIYPRLSIEVSTEGTAGVPIANAGPDQPAHVGRMVTLDGSGSSDPLAFVPLTYHWLLVTKPEGSTAVLSNAAAVNPTFVPDREGDYSFRLIVVNSVGIPSDPQSIVRVSTSNIAPVAAAGADQAVTLLGTTVRLDGSQSYDVDGDPITYHWSFLSIPAGSGATLVTPGDVSASFVADVQGTYTVELVVRDPWTSAVPSRVVVSFANIKPVAVAGSSRTALVGDTVTLDGYGSSDANGDPLSPAWTLVSTPEESASTIATPASIVTTFVPDIPGLYVVQLTVADGFVQSDPSTIQVQVISEQTAAIERVREIQRILTSLDDDQFRNSHLRNSLINVLNAVVKGLSVDNYSAALAVLENDVLTKTDGCVNTGTVDQNDWIIQEQSQGSVYLQVLGALEFIRNIK